MKPHSHSALDELKKRIPILLGIALALVTGHKMIILAAVIIVTSIYYFISGLRRKDIQGSRPIVSYAAIAASFVALAFVALGSGTIGYYIMAAAWLLHVSWDIYLYRINKVVPRWLTQFCMGYDVVVAILLVIAAQKA